MTASATLLHVKQDIQPAARPGERPQMSRPVLFVIDDGGVVLALRGDLSRRFSQDFRVLGESSAAGGWRRCGGWPSGATRWRC
jgi:hypothetical protein